MDMYAHPAFIQDHPELLSQLKKCKHGGNTIKKLKQSGTSSSVTLKSSSNTVSNCIGTTTDQPLVGFTAAISDQMKSNCQLNLLHRVDRQEEMHFKNLHKNESSNSRVVSPCHTSFSQSSPYVARNMAFDRSHANFININDNSLSQVSRNLSISSSTTQIESSNVNANHGKLGLLALAVECLAD